MIGKQHLAVKGIGVLTVRTEHRAVLMPNLGYRRVVKAFGVAGIEWGGGVRVRLTT